MTKTAAAVSAAVSVQSEVALEIVQGTQDMSLDAAINRLGAIQDAERALDKEKKPLRDAAEFALRRAGLDTYATPEGRSVTAYESTRSDWDAAYLASVLTPEQLARAKKAKVISALRVR